MPDKTKGPAEPAALCVLLVEDDEGDAYLISRALAQNPRVAKVVRAHDGVEALEMLRSGSVRPDLAFVDLQMPRKGGLSLMRDLAAGSGEPFPMVVLTSSMAAKDAMRSRLSGALRVVTKPEAIEDMAVVLGQAVEAACPPGPRGVQPGAGRAAGERSAIGKRATAAAR